VTCNCPTTAHLPGCPNDSFKSLHFLPIQPPPVGWICPCCRGGVSPFAMRCPCTLAVPSATGAGLGVSADPAVLTESCGSDS
jgi:hypothetical protein